MTTKVCIKCTRTLSEAHFYRDRSKKDGLYIMCKNCKSESDRERYERVLKMRPITELWRTNLLREWAR